MFSLNICNYFTFIHSWAGFEAKETRRYSAGNLREYCRSALCLSDDFFPGTVEIHVKDRKNTEKQNRDNVFNPLDMGVKIRECVVFLQQADGYEVVPEQLGQLPVNLRQAAEECGNRPDADECAAEY